MELRATTTIRTEPATLFAYWRRLENLPGFVAHLDDVRPTGTRTSRWTASLPFGRPVRWDAEIVAEVAAARLEWQSLPGAEVPSSGLCQFAPAPDGNSTELRVRLTYDVPGTIGDACAGYFGDDPDRRLADDLRRLRQIVETGEVLRSDGAPWGADTCRRPRRPARPLSDEDLTAARAGAGRLRA